MARERSVAGAPDGPVAVYKTLLRELVDRRPSGTRQKIAAAIGKHKSFVSQITNPGYAMPVPAKHLSTIFELCHFSPEERRTFLEAYARAHPGRSLPVVAPDSEDSMLVSIPVPVLGDPGRQADLEEAIRSVAAQLGAMASKWERVQSMQVRSKRGSGS